MRGFSPSGHVGVLSGLGFAIGMVSLAPAPVRADEIIDRIQQMAVSTDMQERRALCDEVLDMSPRVYARRFCEGYELIHAGLHDLAEQAMVETLSEESDFALAPLLYGEAYEALGDLARAERYYQWAIQAAPTRTDTRNALGRLYLSQGEAGDPNGYTKALEAFRQMAEAAPQSADGFSNMGYVLTRMNRYDDAEKLFQRAIAKAPSDPAALDNLAALYALQQRSAEAESAWRRALSLNPGYGPAVVELASLYGRDGKILEALTTLRNGRHAVVAPPWGPKVRRNLGFAFLGSGFPDRAREELEDAVSKGSDDALTHLGLAHVRMSAGETGPAVDAFRRGAGLDSTVSAPFLAAWAPQLRSEVERSGVGGALANQLAALQANPGSTQQVLAGATGAAATPALVNYVLEDWNLKNGDLAVQQYDAAIAQGDIQGFDTPPRPLTQVPAEYPDRAQEQGLEGEVMVKVTVGVDGTVTNAVVEETRADASLGAAAIAAASKWVFEPAMRYGNPVEASIVIPFRFTAKR